MQPRSESLFHFTNSLHVLQLILKNGISPRFCLEDLKWFGVDDLEFYAYAMSCFCDIPLSRIDEHTSFYGEFGIGLTKEWGNRNSLNPVCYVPESGALKGVARYIACQPSEDKDERKNDVQAFATLMRLIKPLQGDMVVGGKLINKDFYQESEWRYTPEIDAVIPYEHFEEEKDKGNLAAEEYTLELSPADIRYIVVPTDASIPSLVDFLNTELGHFPMNDIKVLQTRIVTLDSLRADM
jgi:hypothetical protein